jgi:hypothetical protein
MDDFERRIELARQVGRLRGAIEGCLYCYEDTMPSAAIRELRKVLEDTGDEPIGGVNDKTWADKVFVENIREEVLDKELRERFPLTRWRA